MSKPKVRIIFVHGIGGKPPRARHLREWRQSLGLKTTDVDVSYSMAYWADLRTKGSLTIPTKREAQDLVRNALSPVQRRELMNTESYRKRFIPGYRRLLNCFQNIILSASEPLVRVFLDRMLDDVYDYFYREGKREAIMQRLEDEWEKAITNKEQVVLITHSLGTVVGLDVVQKLRFKPVPLFITMGSPLGSEWIQSRLLRNEFPRNVERWLNVYDPVDIVTLPDQKLRNDFMGLNNERVNDIAVPPNYSQTGERDPHHWHGYLTSHSVQLVVNEYLAHLASH